MAELAERLCLNLPDALTSDIEFLAHFLQRPRSPVIQAEPQTQHLLLTVRQGVEDLLELILQQTERCGLRRNRNIVILNEGKKGPDMEQNYSIRPQGSCLLQRQ